MLAVTNTPQLKEQYQEEILMKLRRTRIFVLPCYLLTLLYFLYVDIYKNDFMPAAYARIPALATTALFGMICLNQKFYLKWGYFLHHFSLLVVMGMMTFILSQSVEKPFYNAAITACVMIIVIVLVEEKGGLKVTLPIYLIPAICLSIYFIYIDIPSKKVSALSNPIAFIMICLVYSQVQERFRWREFLNMKTIQKQREETEKLYEDVLTKNKEIATKKDEISTQNEELTQLNEELTVLVETVAQQNKEIQSQNTKITSSITYAKRLQTAILPNSERFEDTFGKDNFFIFYKPKDIISGDFYWLHDDETQVILAVVDCTGHGVPGAFMSVMGSQLLSEIVEQKQIFSPNKILDELHIQIRRILKQEHTDNRDGMDIQVIRWQKNNHILQFASAMNPLYYIVNRGLNDEEAQDTIVIIKADKKSIGGYQNEATRVFTLNEIELKESMILYFFTDGYQDQFGGKQGKKFSTGQLQELLLNIQHEDLASQQEILAQRIADWQHEGNEYQVDDITAIGIRILPQRNSL